MGLNIPDIIQFIPFRAFIKGFRHGQQEKLSFRALDLACVQNHSENGTGCRWADAPKKGIWGARSTSHRWLGRWQNDGTWIRLMQSILGLAELAQMISWGRASIDGSFAAGKGGGEGVEYGFKGKGVTIHALSDGNGMPLSLIHTGAATSERDQVIPLLDSVNPRTGLRGRSRKRPVVVQMDKGYDSRELRKKNP